MRQVTVHQIRESILEKEKFNILVLPGGQAPNQCNELEELGERRIKEWIAKGGGFIGICAGAQVACEWGMGLLRADVLDIEHWNRGSSDVCRIEQVEEHKASMGAVGVEQVIVRYNCGPLFNLLETSPDKNIREGPTVIAHQASEVRKHRDSVEMRGTPAILLQSYGKGKVLAVSCHWENGEPISRPHFRNLVRACCGCPNLEETDISKWTKNSQSISTNYKANQTMKSEKKSIVKMAMAKPRVRSVDAKPTIDTGSKVKTPTSRNTLTNLKRETGSANSDVSTASSSTPIDRPSSLIRRNSKSPGLSIALKQSISYPRDPYLFSIDGPILITAPHSMPIRRFEQDTGKQARMHLRERWAAQLVVKMAQQLKTNFGDRFGSFFIWDQRATYCVRNLDPNYLWSQQQKESPWHRGLHQFAKQQKEDGCPLFHVDFHGKREREDNVQQVDIGFSAMQSNWWNFEPSKLEVKQKGCTTEQASMDGSVRQVSLEL